MKSGGEKTGEDLCRCQRPFTDRQRFALRSEGSTEEKCFRCALFDRRLLLRSARVSLLVGTLLILINQGDQILGGSFGPVMLWKIPLTYAVPFGVVTYGSLANARR
jgi:hypothetical protein